MVGGSAVASYYPSNKDAPSSDLALPVLCRNLWLPASNLVYDNIFGFIDTMNYEVSSQSNTYLLVVRKIFIPHLSSNNYFKIKTGKITYLPW